MRERQLTYRPGDQQTGWEGTAQSTRSDTCSARDARHAHRHTDLLDDARADGSCMVNRHVSCNRIRFSSHTKRCEEPVGGTHAVNSNGQRWNTDMNS